MPLFLLLGSSCLIPNRTICKPKIPTNPAAKIVSREALRIESGCKRSFAVRTDVYPEVELSQKRALHSGRRSLLIGFFGVIPAANTALGFTRIEVIGVTGAACSVSACHFATPSTP